MLEIKNLHAAVEGKEILRGIDLDLPSGEVHAIMGPNGSGKSTLLRLLAGLGRTETGGVFWNGADALADRTAHGARVAYVGHQDAVKPGLTVAENLGRGAEAALASVGLENLAELPARMLSAGQKRRLALARLAAREAPLWLLDEPTLGLDTASVARFGAMLASHRAKGGVVVTATHLPLPLPDAAEFTFA